VEDAEEHELVVLEERGLVTENLSRRVTMKKAWRVREGDDLEPVLEPDNRTLHAGDY